MIQDRKSPPEQPRPASPIEAAKTAVASAADDLKKHGAEARTISRDFLLQRRKAIQQDLQAAIQRINDANKYLTRMEGCLADVEDLIRGLEASAPPPASPAAEPQDEPAVASAKAG